MISQEQRKQCIDLYRQGIAISEIINQTGIRSTQTIYKILQSGNIERRPTKAGFRATISFDEQTAEIIRKANPKNLSQYICMMVQKAQ